MHSVSVPPSPVVLLYRRIENAFDILPSPSSPLTYSFLETLNSRSAGQQGQKMLCLQNCPQYSGEYVLPSCHPNFLVGTDSGSQYCLGLQIGKELSILLPPFALEGCPVSGDKT